MHPSAEDASRRVVAAWLPDLQLSRSALVSCPGQFARQLPTADGSAVQAVGVLAVGLFVLPNISRQTAEPVGSCDLWWRVMALLRFAVVLLVVAFVS